MRLTTCSSAALRVALLCLSLIGCVTAQGRAERPWVEGAQRVTFPSRDADRGRAPTSLVGWLFRPPGRGPFPAVVALHGCGGLYGSRGGLGVRHRDWAERLSRSGYVVLLADSFTSRGIDQICTLRDRTIHPWRERVADAYGALAYLEALPFVRPDRIGSRDDWTPAAPCLELTTRTRAAGGPMDLLILDGAYHGFDAPATPTRVRHGIATTPTGTATVGTHEAARRTAIARVEQVLRDALDGAPRAP